MPTLVREKADALAGARQRTPDHIADPAGSLVMWSSPDLAFRTQGGHRPVDISADALDDGLRLDFVSRRRGLLSCVERLASAKRAYSDICCGPVALPFRSGSLSPHDLRRSSRRLLTDQRRWGGLLGWEGHGQNRPNGGVVSRP